MIFVVGGGGSGGDVYAFILVTYPAGSTCTASNGTTTLTAGDTSGSWVFKIPTPASTPETWTVTSTDGGDTASTTVSISSEGQSESVELSYNYYVITNGVIGAVGFSTRTRSDKAATTSAGTGYYQIQATGNGVGVGTNSAVDITTYSTLKIEFDCTSSESSTQFGAGVIAIIPTIPQSSWSDLNTHITARSTYGGGTGTGKTLSLNVSSYTGNYYLIIVPGYSSSGAIWRVKNFWLE